MVENNLSLVNAPRKNPKETKAFRSEKVGIEMVFITLN